MAHQYGCHAMGSPATSERRTSKQIVQQGHKKRSPAGRKMIVQFTLNKEPKIAALTATAILRLREHEPEEGYYLAFSGGKDSVVIHDLAVRARVKFDPHYSQTTVDPPEVQQFIKEHYPHVAWDKPRNSMFRLIPLKKMMPTRLIRYCCSDLKEIGGAGRTVVTCIRWAESTARSGRELYEQSRKTKSKWFLHPIID